MKDGTAQRATQPVAAVCTAVKRHAEEAYPLECCGALLMRGGEVIATVPLHNAAVDSRRAYLIAPADYRFAETEALRLDAQLGGFYHSHPDAAPEPSSTDLAMAWPGMLYVIVAVQRGIAAGWSTWTAAPSTHEGRLESCPIT
jgi:proteasome lid subunit RPN8/RPN11